MVHAIPDAVALSDGDGRIVFVNAACESATDRARLELAELPDVFVTPDDHAVLPADGDPASRALRGERFDSPDLGCASRGARWCRSA